MVLRNLKSQLPTIRNVKKIGFETATYLPFDLVSWNIHFFLRAFWKTNIFSFYISDEGPETGEDSDEDIVRSYLPSHGGHMADMGMSNMGSQVSGDTNHNIPAINITLHSPTTNHVLGKFLYF